MSRIHQIKTQLVNNLWLPRAKKGGDILYPRLRKNKKMKLLTLTGDRNLQEIIVFEQNNLTTQDRVIVWTYGHIKKLRLETELSQARVFGPTRYEDSISCPFFSISNQFPFDIINLDFSSQDPDLESGRVEKEIECLEKTISLQGNKGFVLIYTTLLNSNDLDYMRLVSNSNAIHVSGWSGITPGNYPPSVTDQREKIRCIKSMLTELFSKYNYDCEIEEQHYDANTNKEICSNACLLSERE